MPLFRRAARVWVEEGKLVAHPGNFPPYFAGVMPSVARSWLLFGALSLAAVAVGCWVASAHGVSDRVWCLNLAAWPAGLGLAVALSYAKSERWWPALALIGLVLTFFFDGMSGVHRWIGIGPVRLNAAELLLPAALVALPLVTSRINLACAALIVLALALQPDASQAVAFAGGAIASLIASDTPRRIWFAAGFAVLAALSFLRPDALAPVPEVEGIIGLAYAMSPAIAALAALTLAGACLAPLVAARSPSAWGFAAYLCLAALAPLWGDFPVPLVGMGVSAILGAWLGFGALMGATRRPA